MGSTSMCRWYVNQLPPGQCFHTRELLTYGKRGTIDKATQAMVRSGMVLKVARAVFVRNDINLKEPTIEEIASTKARAFGKHIIPSELAQAAKLGLERPSKLRKKGNKLVPPKPPYPGTTFAVLGTTSEFWTVHGYVRLKHLSARKFFAAQHNVGELLTGIWQASKEAKIDFQKILAKANLQPQQHIRMRELAAWVPEWVHEKFRNLNMRGKIHAPWRLYPFVELAFPKSLVVPKLKVVRESPEVYAVGTKFGVGQEACAGCEDALDLPAMLGLLNERKATEYNFKIVKSHFSSAKILNSG